MDVTIMLKDNLTEAVLAILLAERARVAELIGQGIIEDHFFAADWSKVWVVFQGDSGEAVEGVLSTLLMHRFLTWISSS